MFWPLLRVLNLLSGIRAQGLLADSSGAAHHVPLSSSSCAPATGSPSAPQARGWPEPAGARGQHGPSPETRRSSHDGNPAGGEPLPGGSRPRLRAWRRRAAPSPPRVSLPRAPSPGKPPPSSLSPRLCFGDTPAETGPYGISDSRRDSRRVGGNHLSRALGFPAAGEQCLPSTCTRRGPESWAQRVVRAGRRE